MDNITTGSTVTYACKLLQPAKEPGSLNEHRFVMNLDSLPKRNKNYTEKSTKHITIFHQNIRGLGTKSSEIIGHLHPSYPHALCLTEHHLKHFQIKNIQIENYKLGASFCRDQYEKGGVAIYIRKNLQCSNIDVSKYSKDKDIEICAIKTSYYDLNICIISIYRSPYGNFDCFLQNLDSTLQTLYSASRNIIICGDINIDYLAESERKNQLDNLLLSYNLTSIITFPTRLQNTSATAIDNMFLDTSRLKEYTVIPIINGLSDHDAQLLKINTEISHRPMSKLKTVRKFNKYTITDFINKLSEESWDGVFNSEDINGMFNSFLNDYLRIYNSSFPPQTVKVRKEATNNKWITKGIKISCIKKRNLYLACRHNTNEDAKQHY
jgi:exonuclease III